MKRTPELGRLSGLRYAGALLCCEVLCRESRGHGWLPAFAGAHHVGDIARDLLANCLLPP